MSDVAVIDAPAAVNNKPPPRPDAPVADVAALLNAGSAVNLVRNENVLMSFRKDKETGTRRPSFWLTVPVPTMDAVIAKLTEGTPEEISKYSNYMLDLIAEKVIAAAKEQVGDEENPVTTQEQLRLELLSFEALVNQPPSARRGAGIPEPGSPESSRAACD